MSSPSVFIKKLPEIISTWRVEANEVDDEGGIDFAIFSGRDAEVRAREYASWKYPTAEASLAA